MRRLVDRVGVAATFKRVFGSVSGATILDQLGVLDTATLTVHVHVI